METEKKYKLTDEFIIIDGKKLYQIEALKDFFIVKKGDRGGFIESEDNLSQYGNCWIYIKAVVYGNSQVYGNAEVYEKAEVYDSAKIYGNSKVYGDAVVYGNAKVYENAVVYGYAKVYENTEVCDNAVVYGDSLVYGNAKIYGNAVVSRYSDYIVFKNWWSSGRYFTWTKSNNMWKVGCFYGTGQELIDKAYKDSEHSGKEYERVVKYVESILKDEK